MSEPALRRVRFHALRLCLSILVGCIVTAIAVPVSWHKNSHNWLLNSGQYETRYRLWAIKNRIEEYAKTNGTVPGSLNQLPASTVGSFTSKSGSVVDGWGRPFEYVVIEGKGVATSHGLDGLPGGIGFDYDFSTDDLSDNYFEPDAAHPTLRQFVFESDNCAWFVNSQLAGMFIAIVCFFCTSRPKDFTPELIVALGFVLLLCAVLAIIIAAWLTGPLMRGF
ncbi:MAG: hypothetical protein IT365_21060 [Candidatus Hydrogenedentes bacterium]|nr:hypothetical protein [Candidatus Hydrogenedentota bacterium]